MLIKKFKIGSQAGNFYLLHKQEVFFEIALSVKNKKQIKCFLKFFEKIKIAFQHSNQNSQISITTLNPAKCAKS